ncbi:MAG: 5-formyltetrahydrofolate cyclo-ligase [Cyclobacteriaceae bacterium]
MSDAKAKIRKGTLLNRRLMKPDVWQERVALAENLLLKFVEQNQIRSCHLFLPIKRNNEFDSWPVVNRLHENGVKVFVSTSDFESFTMTHFEYSDKLKFQSNRFDIPEPIGNQSADISGVQMILIPLLAADKRGFRIGYGKGFYDRVLADLPSEILKVGINLAPLFDRFGFEEEHDIRLDYCVTPHKIYDCHD